MAHLPLIFESRTCRRARVGALLQFKHLFPIVVVLAAITPFLPATQNGFVAWDDEENFLHNTNLIGQGWGQFSWMLTTEHVGVYQPFAWLILSIQYYFAELNPVIYHWVSIALHALNSLLFYFLAVRILRLSFRSVTPSTLNSEPSDYGTLVGAAFAALLFAVHPLRVEVVAWVSCQPYLPAMAFYLMAILCYLRIHEKADNASVSLRRLIPVLVLYFFAVMSKAAAVTLPAILLLLDIYPLRRLPIVNATSDRWMHNWCRSRARRIWLEKWPFAMVAIGTAAMAIHSKQDIIVPLEYGGIGGRIGQAAYGACFYLLKTIWPANLSPYYSLPANVSLTAPSFLVSVFVVFVMAGLAIILWRWWRWPAGLAVLASYLIILSPMSHIIRIGAQRTADRYSYLSCMGWCILAGATVTCSWRGRNACKWNRRIFLAGCPCIALIVILLGYASWQQTKIWNNSISLWERAHDLDPDNEAIAMNYGYSLLDQERYDQAILFYQGALAKHPNHPGINNNIGVALIQAGNVEEALGYFIRALQYEPNSAKTKCNVAYIYAQLDRIEEAIDLYKQVLSEHPTYSNAHVGLGRLLLLQGDEEQAAQHFLASTQNTPNHADAQNNLGKASEKKGDYKEALLFYYNATQLDPMFIDPYYNSAVILTQLGRFDAAITILREILKSHPNYLKAQLQLDLALERQYASQQIEDEDQEQSQECTQT